MSFTSTVCEDGTLFGYNHLNKTFSILQGKGNQEQYIKLDEEQAKFLVKFFKEFL